MTFSKTLLKSGCMNKSSYWAVQTKSWPHWDRAKTLKCCLALLSYMILDLTFLYFCSPRVVIPTLNITALIFFVAMLWFIFNKNTTKAKP